MKTIIVYILGTANVVAGLFVGSFCVGNVILPIFVSLPFVRQLARQNLLSKSVPRATFIVTPLVFSLISLACFYVYLAFLPNYLPAFTLGFCLGCVGIIRRAFQGTKHPDVQADLQRYYRDYIRTPPLPENTQRSVPPPEDGSSGVRL